MPELALSFEIRICQYMSFLLTTSPLINLQVMANRVCEDLTNACLHVHVKQRVVLIFRGDWMPRIQIWRLRQWSDFSVISVFQADLFSDDLVSLVSEVGEPQNISCFCKNLLLMDKC